MNPNPITDSVELIARLEMVEELHCSYIKIRKQCGPEFDNEMFGIAEILHELYRRSNSAGGEHSFWACAFMMVVGDTDTDPRSKQRTKDNVFACVAWVAFAYWDYKYDRKKLTEEKYNLLKLLSL